MSYQADIMIKGLFNDCIDTFIDNYDVEGNPDYCARTKMAIDIFYDIAHFLDEQYPNFKEVETLYHKMTIGRWYQAYLDEFCPKIFMRLYELYPIPADYISKLGGR